MTPPRCSRKTRACGLAAVAYVLRTRGRKVACLYPSIPARLHHHHNIPTQHDLILLLVCHHVISYLLLTTTLCDDMSIIAIHPLSGQTKEGDNWKAKREREKKDRASSELMSCPSFTPTLSPPLHFPPLLWQHPPSAKNALSLYASIGLTYLLNSVSALSCPTPSYRRHIKYPTPSPQHLLFPLLLHHHQSYRIHKTKQLI